MRSHYRRGSRTMARKVRRNPRASASRDPRRRRKIGRKILIMLLLIAGIVLANRTLPWREWTAEEGAQESVGQHAGQAAVQDGGESLTETPIEEAAVDSSAKAGLLAGVHELGEKYLQGAIGGLDSLFVLRYIELEGTASIARDSLLQYCQALEGNPLFKIDLDALARRMEAHPRVRRALVKRLLPHTLQVKIEERREEMCVVVEDGLVGVDRYAIALPDPVAGYPLDVPLVTGFKGELSPGDTLSDSTLIAALAWTVRARQEPRVHGWISEIQLGESNVVSILGRDGWRVGPGDHPVTAQVAALDAFLEQKTRELREPAKIDLRFPGYLIVRRNS